MNPERSGISVACLSAPLLSLSTGYVTQTMENFLRVPFNELVHDSLRAGMLTWATLFEHLFPFALPLPL
jgi:hypothetical protein